MAAQYKQKLYYSIGEVSKMLGVNASLIRYWEKEFDHIKPRKNRKGNRLFTEKNIENLRFIYHLVKEKGYTLEGAKKILKSQSNEARENYELLNTLRSTRQFLVDIRNEIDDQNPQ